MSIWVIYGIVATVGVLVIAGIVVGSILLWRRQVRKSLVGLVGRRESVSAAYRGLEAVFGALGSDDPAVVSQFAIDPTSTHRKALEELQTRMAIEAEELQNVALPKRFWPAADLLMSSAIKLRDEVGRINQAPTPDAVLDGVAAIDVTGIRAAIAAAGEELDRQLHETGVDDSAIYGGGLYI
jgi:hypothetical protein